MDKILGRMIQLTYYVKHLAHELAQSEPSVMLRAVTTAIIIVTMTLLAKIVLFNLYLDPFSKMFLSL